MFNKNVFICSDVKKCHINAKNAHILKVKAVTGTAEIESGLELESVGVDRFSLKTEL